MLRSRLRRWLCCCAGNDEAENAGVAPVPAPVPSPDPAPAPAPPPSELCVVVQHGGGSGGGARPPTRGVALTTRADSNRRVLFDDFCVLLPSAGAVASLPLFLAFEVTHAQHPDKPAHGFLAYDAAVLPDGTWSARLRDAFGPPWLLVHDGAGDYNAPPCARPYGYGNGDGAPYAGGHAGDDDPSESDGMLHVRHIWLHASVARDKQRRGGANYFKLRFALTVRAHPDESIRWHLQVGHGGGAATHMSKSASGKRARPRRKR